MPKIRQPAVAGQFYPAQPQALMNMVHQCLGSIQHVAHWPKAIVAPHAGYIYSGEVAGSAYRFLMENPDKIQRVVVLGPSHHVGFDGVAISHVDSFATPLGIIPVDRDAIVKLLALPQVRINEQAFDQEHSVEVHLPFLQQCLKYFNVIPLVVGQAQPQIVANVLNTLWGGPETLIVVSSDLSHYHDYQTAQICDQKTSKAIEQLNYAAISGYDACGCHPLNGLLLVAKERGMRAVTIDQRNSGDTAGNKDRVVGYGAYHFLESV